MFRKMLWALVATAGLVVPAAMPSTAEAHPSYCPPVVAPRVVHHLNFEVMFRCSPREGWRVYGTYPSARRAHEIERSLEGRGFQSYIHHC